MQKCGHFEWDFPETVPTVKFVNLKLGSSGNKAERNE
jgi:hypothetical protein